MVKLISALGVTVPEYIDFSSIEEYQSLCYKTTREEYWSL